MPISVLDPTTEAVNLAATSAARLGSLQGTTIGLISNGKEGTQGFFTHLKRLLHDRYNVAEVVLRTKHNYSAPAEAAIIDENQNWHAVVTGIGD